MDLLDWLDNQPTFAPKKPRLKIVSSQREEHEDQLDLVDLIQGVYRAA